METFDYQHQLIHYNDMAFHFVVIHEPQTGIDHIISTEDLSEQLFDNDKGGYKSKDAEWIDEKITYFVQTAKDLERSSKDILAEIYD